MGQVEKMRLRAIQRDFFRAATTQRSSSRKLGERGSVNSSMKVVVSQFEISALGGKTKLWLLVTTTMRRADHVQPHFRATSP